MPAVPQSRVVPTVETWIHGAPVKITPPPTPLASSYPLAAFYQPVMPPKKKASPTATPSPLPVALPPIPQPTSPVTGPSQQAPVPPPPGRNPTVPGSSQLPPGPAPQPVIPPGGGSTFVNPFGSVNNPSKWN